MGELLLERPETGTLDCEYSLLIGTRDVGRFACESYGVRVRNKETGESLSCPDLTLSASEIDDFLERLVRSGVTPTGLADVAAAWQWEHGRT